METSRFNYYDILEIGPQSQQHEVTSAYEKAKLTYSGENPAIYTIFSHEEARDMLKMVEEAYSVLGNKTLRSLYDEKVLKGVVKSDDISFDTLKAQSQVHVPDSLKRISALKTTHEINEAVEEKIKSQTNWTGEFLKEVREYKGLSLEKLSEVTKISSYYIHALESMDSNNLPAVVFVRGYVAQISKTLGLDERKVCESYMKIFKEKIGNK